MGRYINALKIVMGIAMPPMIPANYLTEKFLKTGYVEVAHSIDKETVKGVMCKKVKDLLYYKVSDVTWEYLKANPSNIGTSCYRNEEIVCARWLKDYYKWLADRALDELPTIPDTLPDIPSLPSLPSLPDPAEDITDISKGIKRSFQISALVVIGVVLLIFYMLTGRGKKGVTVVT